MRKADNFDPSKWLVENKITTQSRLNEENQPYKVISKKTKKNEMGDGDVVNDIYSLELKDETYTTPDGLTFQLKTIGSVMIPTGEELDFNDPTHHFFYIQTLVSDENGNQLEKIPGESFGGTYIPNRSISKAKRWLNKRGTQLMSGKGFQHKST